MNVVSAKHKGAGLVIWPDKFDNSLFKCELVGAAPVERGRSGTSRKSIDIYRRASLIKKSKVPLAGNKFHVFLTHEWGVDENKRDNHSRVKAVNTALQAKGLVTWFDEDRMTGNIVDQMCKGIDGSACIAVFVTQRYIDKVGGSNANDNCKKEFSYAAARKGANVMIPIVMEDRVRNPRQWSGAVGMELGGVLYKDCVSDETSKFQAGVDSIYDEVCRIVATQS